MKRGETVANIVLAMAGLGFVALGVWSHVTCPDPIASAMGAWSSIVGAYITCCGIYCLVRYR